MSGNDHRPNSDFFTDKVNKLLAQETFATQRKELEALKMRCDTYQCIHPDRILDSIYDLSDRSLVQGDDRLFCEKL